MLELASLLNFDSITIQCHDNPDADALASAYGLFVFFDSKGKQVRMIYGGRNSISKPNLVEMIEALHIPIIHVSKPEDIEGLLITVDCQYGAGNVTHFNAKQVAIIDHHQPETTASEMVHIQSYLGSCATVVYQLLNSSGFVIEDYSHVATALYYGLFSDTNNFSELSHPADKDMMDDLRYDINLLRKLKNSNLTLADMEIAGLTLLSHSFNSNLKYAIFKSEPCDPNILGFISDIVLQVNSVDTCVIFNEMNGAIKFSVRSCIREVMASELAVFITKGIGSGGGHLEKAGGYISLSKFNELYPNTTIDQYLFDCVKENYESHNIIYSSSYTLDNSKMKQYKKKNITVGYVPTTALFPIGTALLIRSLEGDVQTIVSDQTYIMIGIQGEIYPIKKERFERSYIPSQTPYTLHTEYFPSVKNLLSGESISLKSFAFSCTSTGEVIVYASPLEKATKVFTSWDYTKYMSGKIGDYITIRQDDIHDVYIVEKNIFHQTYIPVEKQ